ncbi:MAG: hypothetical protein NTX25_23580, partial [Proteobacteria bacterium]|nr:hypothetical protein [Pseudomonadota bacterium]
MKEFRKKITYVTSLSLLVFIGCGTPEPASKISSSVPAPQAETPMIGMGYNSMNARVTGSNCFENLPIETTAAHEAELDFYRNLGSKQLSNLLDAGIEIGFPVYPGVTVKGRARYAEEFASGRYAETMTLHFKAIGARTRVYFGDKALDSGFPIKPIDRLLKLKDNSNAKLLLCGDRYISRIDKGLEFTASLKVEFNNEYQKKAYAAGFGAEILGGIAKLDVDASYEKLLSSSNVNVSLAIEQKGGSALDLLQLLPSKDWATDGFNENQIDLAAIPDSEKQILEELKTGITFLNCSFETRNSCYAIFRKISRLAQKIADGVKNDSIDTNQIFENGNLIPIAMNTDPYLKSNGMELLESKNDDDLALQNRYRRANELRGKLLEIYKSTKEARRRAENINLNQENFTKLTGIDSTELTNNQAYSA